MTQIVLSYGWEIRTLGFELKEMLLSTEMKYLEKSAGNTNNFGKTGKQHVEMVWTRSTYGG